MLASLPDAQDPGGNKAVRVDVSQQMPLDFTHRADLEESMDRVASLQEYRTCLDDLGSVGRLVLAHRPTLRFLDRVLSARVGGKPLRILDVACGDGAMLRRIARWSAKRRVSVELTGVELSSRAVEIAQSLPQSDPPVSYITADIFAFEPRELPDVVLSAHFTHHLAEPDVVRFLQWMEQHASLGWFVNDLHRHPNPYRLFRLLGAIVPWHPIVVADGLISIRRAFTVEDWRRMLATAGIAGAVVAEEFPARVTVSRVKQAASRAEARV